MASSWNLAMKNRRSGRPSRPSRCRACARAVCSCLYGITVSCLLEVYASLVVYAGVSLMVFIPLAYVGNL